MATTSVKVPVNASNQKIRDGWICNVSAEIDASKDVKFVDEDDTTVEVNVNMIQMDTAGAIKFRGADYDDCDAQLVSFTAGVWHVVPGICKIFQDETESSKGIHAKLG